MNKSSIILKYFQKVHLLTVDNPDYCRTISSLFEWLTENDRIKNDRTTQLLNLDKQITVKIIARQKLIMAGMEEIAYLLKKYTHLSLSVKCKDSQSVNKDQIVAEITGSTSEVLAYERTVLNILQRMSGIACQTSSLIRLIRSIRPISNIFIAATRKTPWMALDKKAVAAGGGLTHRLDLSDGILIKDNHLKSIREKYHLANNNEAIKKSLELIFSQAKNQLIEVEVENEEEILAAINSFQELNNYICHCEESRFNKDDAAISVPMGLLLRQPADRNDKSNQLCIMFDNFTPAKAKQTIEKIKKDYDVSNIIFEASGGITSENISKWRQTGVDFLSLGSLTHSPKAADLSIEF
ncbi:hypothetical protein MUP32_05050 [Candidatus Microgenomates bacterium]|nr:hypothetical protein [Candidatus Microgenomates bacterium]